MGPAVRTLLNKGLLLVVLVVISGYGGYFWGKGNNKPPLTPNVPNIGAPLPSAKIGTDSIIISQEAVAIGKISKVENNAITIVGSDGKVAVFKLVPKFNIYPLAVSSSGTIKPSQDLKDIKLNGMYQFHLFLQGSEFQVTSIQALPSNPK